jgi:excisionase family DNA binding protein
VTLTADIRLSGDLESVILLQDASPEPADGCGQVGAVPRQEFLTVDQAAEVLHVSRDIVYDLIRAGQLRSIKIGRLRRISRQWITQFAERQERGGRSGR